MTNASAFKTPEGEATFLAAYEAVMKFWPVPYEEIEIPTRFGMTHIITSGPKQAPPLVLLHGMAMTSTMWSPNIADFSREYRLDSQKILKGFSDNNVSASADMTIKQIARQNDMAPTDVYSLLQQIAESRD